MIYHLLCVIIYYLLFIFHCLAFGVQGLGFRV